MAPGYLREFLHKPVIRNGPDYDNDQCKRFLTLRAGYCVRKLVFWDEQQNN